MSETLTEYDDLLDGTEHRWRNRFIALAALAALVAAGAYALWATVLGRRRVHSGGNPDGNRGARLHLPDR